MIYNFEQPFPGLTWRYNHFLAVPVERLLILQRLEIKITDRMNVRSDEDNAVATNEWRAHSAISTDGG